jgi:ribosomal protein S3
MNVQTTVFWKVSSMEAIGLKLMETGKLKSAHFGRLEGRRVGVAPLQLEKAQGWS